MGSSLISAIFAVACAAHTVGLADGAKAARAGYYGRHDPCRQVCNEYIDICLPTWLDPWDFFSPHCEDVRDLGRPDVSCLLCLKIHGVTQSPNRPTRPFPPPITRPVPTGHPTQSPQIPTWTQKPPLTKPPKPQTQPIQPWPQPELLPPQYPPTNEIFGPTNPTTQTVAVSYWPPTTIWPTAQVGSTPSGWIPSGQGELYPSGPEQGELYPTGPGQGELYPIGQGQGELYPINPGQDELYPIDPGHNGQIPGGPGLWPPGGSTEGWPEEWTTENLFPLVTPSSLAPKPVSTTTIRTTTPIAECPDVCTCTRVQTATTEVTTSYCPLAYDADYACDLNDPSAVMTSGDESHCVCEEDEACKGLKDVDYQVDYPFLPNKQALN